MARLTYIAIMSVDGYVTDGDGSFDWAAPDEEVHAFVNELVRPIGTYLYGRRMYEVMSFWQSVPDLEAEPSEIQDFAAMWLAADKVVFSTRLTSVSTPKTRLEREFTPGWIQRAKSEARADIGIGGAELAGQAITAGLIDDFHLVIVPVLVGGGTPALPNGPHTGLRLLAVDRFESGTVHLHYASTDA